MAKDSPCIEHESRISANESFIASMKADLRSTMQKVDGIMKHLWVGVGILAALQFLLNTGLGNRLISYIINTAYAFF